MPLGTYGVRKRKIMKIKKIDIQRFGK